MVLSLVRKTRCPLLWLRSNRTSALMLWVVLVTTIATILRFTITPTTAAVCFWWVIYCGCYATVLLKVLVTVSAVVPILRLTPHHSFYAMVWLFNRSLLGGFWYITHIPLFLAWWHHHYIISIAKWLLTIWCFYVANNHWQSGANYC